MGDRTAPPSTGSGVPDEPSGAPINALVSELEASRFVGRAGPLEVVARARDRTSATRIVHIYGPAGVGKSATLRAIARAAEADGRTVVHLDGRLLGDTPEALADAIGVVAGDTVLLIDEAEQLGPLAIELRRLIYEQVAATAVVVLAGRSAPDTAWFDGGLELVSTAVALRPLSNEESRELLARHGLAAPAADLDRLVAWSAGYPLALTLAATIDASSADEYAPHLAAGPADERLDHLVIERLGGRELAGVDPDVLDVACVASRVDGRLLAAALPGRPTRAGLAQLRACTLSEPLGTGVTLHRLVRAALRTRLRATDPDRYRDIVVRVARHLRTRAVSGDYRVVLELAELVENDDLRLGYDPSTTHYLDRLHLDDLDEVAAFTGAGDTEWMGRLRRWCTESPRHALAVRRAAGNLVGMSILCMADETPPWARHEIETGPVLAHAEAAGHLDDAVLMHDLVIMEDPGDPAACAEVIRVGNNGAITSGVVPNARYVYVTATTWRSDDGTEVLGYHDVPELRRRDRERELTTIMTDFGPDGAVGQMYNLILAEQGVAQIAPTESTALAYDAALRSFLDDDALAASPLAPPAGSTADRAEAVRTKVRQRLNSTFAATSADQLLRQAIERTYLDSDGGHGTAQRELHMSRSTFYRHLRRGRERFAEDPTAGHFRAAAPELGFGSDA